MHATLLLSIWRSLKSATAVTSLRPCTFCKNDCPYASIVRLRECHGFSQTFLCQHRPLQLILTARASGGIMKYIQLQQRRPATQMRPRFGLLNPAVCASLPFLTQPQKPKKDLGVESDGLVSKSTTCDMASVSGSFAIWMNDMMMRGVELGRIHLSPKGCAKSLLKNDEACPGAIRI